MAETELPILEINPNEEIFLPLEEQYQSVLAGEDSDLLLCRVLIQDESEYGLVIPAKVVEGKEICFVLPVQLCIFNPNKTYTFKVEIILDTQLLMPVFGPCRVNLDGLTEEEEEGNESEGQETSSGSTEALNEEDPSIVAALELIAPLPKEQAQIKKSRIEDIAQQLDEEFVKNALWSKPEPPKQTAPIPREVSEPLSPETLAVKQKMKTLLRNMLIS